MFSTLYIPLNSVKYISPKTIVGLPKNATAATIVVGEVTLLLDNHTLYCSAIVHWDPADPAHKSSLVATRSADGGLTFEYAATIADADLYPDYEEGPNESDSAGRSRFTEPPRARQCNPPQQKKAQAPEAVL